MGNAGKSQSNTEWYLEEIIRKMEQKISKGLGTIVGEATNGDKIPKTKVRMEKQAQEQIMDK